MVNPKPLTGDFASALPRLPAWLLAMPLRFKEGQP
jgi:hypothetical protein